MLNEWSTDSMLIEVSIVCQWPLHQKIYDYTRDWNWKFLFLGSRSASAYYNTPIDALNMLEDEDHMPDNT